MFLLKEVESFIFLKFEVTYMARGKNAKTSQALNHTKNKRICENK
jgi:hypothetical protein